MICSQIGSCENICDGAASVRNIKAINGKDVCLHVLVLRAVMCGGRRRRADAWGSPGVCGCQARPNRIRRGWDADVAWGADVAADAQSRVSRVHV